LILVGSTIISCINPFPIKNLLIFTLLPPFIKEGRGEIIWSLSFAPSLEKGRLGRVFYPKISPLKKLGRGSSPPCVPPLHKRWERQRGS